MTGIETTDANPAADLRRAFDLSFAARLETTARTTADFISIRLDGNMHAIRTAEIAGLHTRISITPVPGPIAELIGIAGFRGGLTPVYDLAALLGYPASSGRWVVVDSTRELAFAFDDFDDHFRIDASAILSRQDGAGQHTPVIVRRGAEVWPVIDIPSIVAAIRRRLPHTAAIKE